MVLKRKMKRIGRGRRRQLHINVACFYRTELEKRIFECLCGERSTAFETGSPGTFRPAVAVQQIVQSDKAESVGSSTTCGAIHPTGWDAYGRRYTGARRPASGANLFAARTNRRVACRRSFESIGRSAGQSAPIVEPVQQYQEQRRAKSRDS